MRKKKKIDYKVTAVLLFVGGAFWLADGILVRQFLSGAVGLVCLAMGFVNVAYCKKCTKDDEE